MKNPTLIEAGKSILKELLSKCTESEVLLFKRMYCHKNLEFNIDQCVNQINPDKIDWAITQCETTLKNKIEK